MPIGRRGSFVPGVENSRTKSCMVRRLALFQLFELMRPPAWQLPQRAFWNLGLRPLRLVPKKMSTPRSRSFRGSGGTARVNPSTTVMHGWRFPTFTQFDMFCVNRDERLRVAIQEAIER